MSRSALRLAVLLSTAAALAYPPPSTAAPVTLELNVHLLTVCTFGPSDCEETDQYVPFTVTYDPDAFVIQEVPDGWIVDASATLEIASPLEPVTLPWDGPHQPYAFAMASFSRLGGRTIEVFLADRVILPSCIDGIACVWESVYRFVNQTVGTPLLSEPTAADFETLFTRGQVEFYTTASYHPTPDEDRVYVPESRDYIGEVPEPGVLILLGFGVATALGRRRLSR